MQLPATRIRLARAIGADLAQIDRTTASALTADAIRLIRDLGCSPELAGRVSSARALSIIAERRP